MGAGAEEGDLRLSDSGAAENGAAEWGRLEVFRDGGWGTVCNLRDRFGSDDTAPFTPESVTVACRQLGYDGGARIQSQVRVQPQAHAPGSPPLLIPRWILPALPRGVVHVRVCVLRGLV